MGRPSLYKPEYCDALIEHMKGGLSFESFAGRCGVCKQTLYAWCEAHKEFNEAKAIGESLSLLWWEQAGKAGLLGQTVKQADGTVVNFKSFNATVWIFSMKNRFGWRDRHPDEAASVIEPLIIKMPMAKETLVITQPGQTLPKVN